MSVEVGVEHGGRGLGDAGAWKAAAGGDVRLAAGERELGGVRVAAVGVAASVAAGEEDVEGLEGDVDDARGGWRAAQEDEERVEAAEVDESLRLFCVCACG